jgi:hypothetical protein
MNGSEGILRVIDHHDIGPRNAGKYAAVTIVEFPNCHESVHVDGLPPTAWR